MSLTIVTAVCGSLEITGQWLQETIGRCQTDPELIVAANGCTDEELKWLGVAIDAVKPAGWFVCMDQEPLGSTRAFNRGLAFAHGDIVALLHNDLMVREHGWDQRVLDFFESQPDAGVVGFHGSTMLADDRVYQGEYRLQNLSRGDSWSNLEDAEHHGRRSTELREVVTVDGMALIARRDDLAQWGGLDERYVHHMYDHDLCTTARQNGRRNWMLPVRARHISGQTANMSRYNEHFDRLGRDAGIHAAAHVAFYSRWKGTGMIPARLYG